MTQIPMLTRLGGQSILQKSNEDSSPTQGGI
jgi:hypothetical protein